MNAIGDGAVSFPSRVTTNAVDLGQYPCVGTLNRSRRGNGRTYLIHPNADGERSDGTSSRNAGIRGIRYR